MELAGHNGIVQHALSQFMSYQLDIFTWLSFIAAAYHKEISSSNFPTLLATEDLLFCISTFKDHLLYHMAHDEY